MNSQSLIAGMRRRVLEEEGALRKEAALRVALCHPSPYAAAMSSLGFQTIYREIHAHPEAAAERAFLPETPGLYRTSRLPVMTYETGTPLAEFPVVAFSIAYELELAGIFEMLDLSGIPPLRHDRTDRHPLIVAGGPLTYSNPAILAPFVDLVLLGEGEDLVHVFLDAAASMRREELLSHLSRMPGCAVPGRTAGSAGMGKAADERLPARSQILTKNTVLSSMFLVEPERGCSRGCAFCVMRCTTNGGMRLVDPEKVLSLIPANSRRVGLVGAAVTDHPGIRYLIRKIVSGGREIGVSSLRADRLDAELVQLLAQGGYQTLTTAADGASQRLRDAAGRNISEQHLLRAAELARGAGLRRMKVYQLLGLPGESAEDVEELVRFSRELASIVPLSMTLSPFVAKKNTPMDGAPFEPVRSQSAKLARIRKALKGKVDIKPVSVRWAWVEYMLSQGDESAGLAAMDAWKAGGDFASWRRAFADRGMSASLTGAGPEKPMEE